MPAQGYAFARVQQPVERAPDNAGVGVFGIADLPGFVNVLMGQTDIGDGRNLILIGNKVGPLPLPPNLAPVLCRVVFVGKPVLGGAFDGERIALCTAPGSSRR